ncbi:hypothetical protein ACIBHY_29820 [Nonomuraea sp. NPDC050547]|uniref:hypothetical protein n=1 Tax=Nonomuraea sp. NPDC050547 TaxID=3364368 RepID=UPI0037AEE41E
MTAIQIASIVIPFTLKGGTLLFAYLARRNQLRNVAESATDPRVCVGTGADGTPIYLTAPADLTADVIRQRRGDA